MSQLVDLADKRMTHEALKHVLVSHAQSMAQCRCWQDDLHGVAHLKRRLAHMMALAERLEETLVDIQAIETSVFSRD